MAAVGVMKKMPGFSQTMAIYMPAKHNLFLCQIPMMNSGIAMAIRKETGLLSPVSHTIQGKTVNKSIKATKGRNRDIMPGSCMQCNTWNQRVSYDHDDIYACP